MPSSFCVWLLYTNTWLPLRCSSFAVAAGSLPGGVCLVCLVSFVLCVTRGPVARLASKSLRPTRAHPSPRRSETTAMTSLRSVRVPCFPRRCGRRVTSLRALALPHGGPGSSGRQRECHGHGLGHLLADGQVYERRHERVVLGVLRFRLRY